MKKSLFSKIALALVLVSVSTQTFGHKGNEWFNKYPKAKRALGAVVTATPLFAMMGAVIYNAIMMGRDYTDQETSKLNQGIYLVGSLSLVCGLITHKFPVEGCLASLLVTGCTLASQLSFKR